MDLTNLVDQLKAQRSQLDRAINALQGIEPSEPKRRRKYKMSAEARKKISEAAKKRWATAKKS